MNYRECETLNGVKFLVPEHIQRIDTPDTKIERPTHGWQLRFGQWTFYKDRSTDEGGAEASLAEATQELLRRIHSLDAPTGLRTITNSDKKTPLPVGISGPIKRIRKGRKVPEFSFGVTIPRFGEKPTNINVYIGTESTITNARYDQALAKAIEIRNKAVAAFQEAVNIAKREKAPLPAAWSGREHR